MSQLRSDILSKGKHAPQELEDSFVNNNNKVSSPTSNNSTIESNNLSIEQSEATKAVETTEMTGGEIIDDSETSDDDDEENWSNIIESWVDILDLENQLENGKIVDNEPPEFEFCGHIIHLADDPSAKWNLSELFDSSLDAPISFVF
ncbi:12271_t:CDS:2 [Racocetra fulgida]|uniref:12271_t:CDS:1 n=1 Tax=Racocetra fulgida TaxID=60492 RepID=A0A9N8WPC5_9GLOM|nr:12271_t:CDS:2 [Racocetra fulgida]